MEAADSEGKESSSFRWAHAARYVVASVVTILIVVVVVKAVMVLRPVPLYLSVPGGSVFVRRSASQPEEVQFHFSLKAVNPSYRVQMYFTGIFGFISGKNMSASSVSSNMNYITMTAFNFPNMSLPVRKELIRDAIVHLRRNTVMSPSFFDWLYEATSSGGGIITDMTLSLKGTLTTRMMPEGSNTTGREITFYCRPLLVLAAGNQQDVDTSLNQQDAFCVSGVTPGSKRLR